VTFRPSWFLVLVAGAIAAPSPVRSQPVPGAPDTPSTPVRAAANDNTQSAGVLKDGVLSLHLVARRVTWYPEAEDGPTQAVEAFSEAGKAPSVPGPLIRIPLGTTIDATITNSLADTLVVLGLRGRNDSLRIAPNGVATFRHKPPASGSFLYAASDVRDGKTRFGGTRGQLVGGLIVDAGAPPKDRIFIATGWDPVPIAGNPYFLTMNGKSWPYTEKFVHTVGDTVRWRVLNGGAGTSAHHPMHLHGFYYRVDARGGWDADTSYGAGQQRWVVTENLPGLASMSMTWVPERPGNWLFHCHNADHVAGRHRHMIAGRGSPFPPPPLHDAQQHLAWDMSGLAHAITILPRAGAEAAEARAPDLRAKPARVLRLLVQVRPRYYGPGPGFGYVLQDGATEPAPDSINIPGPPLVFRRDEPVEITVVNRLTTHTTVHWHGIELESFYDGIAGWSGSGTAVAPMLAPRDSFVVRFTPPRAGTFIYHAHVTDHVQLARGLYGALVVVAPDHPSAPGTDHVAIVGLGRPDGRAGLLLNGSVSPAPLDRRREGPQRIRLINISPENNVIFTLSADSMPMRWRAIAKDGFDLPTAQRRVLPARVQVFPGETYDFEFESAADAVHLRMKNPATGPGIDDITLSLRTRP
jgi:FtsP/CotA-like multicopper oxidase with cupredoxin domain